MSGPRCSAGVIHAVHGCFKPTSKLSSLVLSCWLDEGKTQEKRIVTWRLEVGGFKPYTQ